MEIPGQLCGSSWRVEFTDQV